MLVGDRVAERIRPVVARIDHGVEVVDVGHDHLRPLPDVLVVLAMKLMGRHRLPRRHGRWQAVDDDSEESLDRRQPEGLGVRQVRLGDGVVAVAEEADVVELDLVEALVRQVTGDPAMYRPRPGRTGQARCCHRNQARAAGWVLCTASSAGTPPSCRPS